MADDADRSSVGDRSQLVLEPLVLRIVEHALVSTVSASKGIGTRTVDRDEVPARIGPVVVSARKPKGVDSPFLAIDRLHAEYVVIADDRPVGK